MGVELHATHHGILSARAVAHALAEATLEIVAPTRCAGCDAYGALMCRRCADDLWRYDGAIACPHCAAPFGELVCTECWDRTLPFSFTVALGALEGALARAVVLHKDHNERRLGPVLGATLGGTVALAHPDWACSPTAVTWVPPSPRAHRRRDFDHGRSIASGVAAGMGVEQEAFIAHRGSRDNRRLDRASRVQNVAQAFELVAPPPPRVVLVDDVMTSGATAVACAEVLLAGGAQQVALAVLARAW